ncbi:hypothetical protein ACI2K6_09415 [Microbacterium sp. NPDC006705]|uniref:hypothetical protein n=1 Tax=Microbacterium sp. NPDC006705 TaxID=3364181 RepID=UPI00384AED75
MRLTWAQPEDLVPAELVALREQGAPDDELSAIERVWTQAGGATVLAPSGASATPASPELRAEARRVLDELQGLQRPSADEPDEWDAIAALLPAQPEPSVGDAAFDRVHGAWLGRSAGCLLGKPVEKIPREGN